MTLSLDNTVTLFELLVILLGIVIVWAIYRASDQAELPGEAKTPDPRMAEDISLTMEGRTL